MKKVNRFFFFRFSASFGYPYGIIIIIGCFIGSTNMVVFLFYALNMSLNSCQAVVLEAALMIVGGNCNWLMKPSGREWSLPSVYLDRYFLVSAAGSTMSCKILSLDG